MADRYGTLYAGFTEWDDPATVISSGGVFSVEGITAAEVTKKLGFMTRGKFVMEMQDNWDAFVRKGRIVFLYQGDGVLGTTREVGSFLVEKATPSVAQDGRQVVTVSGLGREQLLTKYRHWEPIGEETIYATTLTANAVAPWTVTVAGGGVPAGNDSVTLSSDAGVEVGDEVRIQLNDDSWFIGTVTGIDLPLAAENQIQYEPRCTGTADAGNDVELRKRWLSVDDAEGIEAGMRLELELNSGTFVTLVEGLLDGRIHLETGVTGLASSGNDVEVFDYSEPALDDVEQIMARATGWTYTVVGGAPGAKGTTNGTAHAPKGESVWELLTLAAQQSGEFFRVAPLVGGRPVKRIDWYRSSDDSALTLVLYTSISQAALNSATEDANIGIIHSIAREDEHNVITRIYPSASDGRISLSYCTAAALSAANAAGFTVVVSEDLYEPDYVQYGPGVSEHGILSDVVRYGNIQLSDTADTRAGVSELAAAADAMLAQAMSSLREAQERTFWRVKAHTHKALWPGQRVALSNPAMEPLAGGVYYVLEVREVLEKGLIMSYLLLSSELAPQQTVVRSLGRELLTMKQAARRETSASSDRSAQVVSGGGGGGDHGGLTGLGDDDHTQYLRTDGARTLVGNMAAAAGVTFDGVDVSAHAADPAAHHAPVTAYDGSITVDGQAIRIADAAAGAGLSLTAGALAVNAAAALGTVVSGDTVGVAPAEAGGLENNSLGLRVKRPTSSGLAVGSEGLFLSPGSVGAATANGNSGISHTHLVLAYEDAKATPGQVMKSSAAGDHTLRYLTADTVVTPLVTTAAGTLALEPAGALVDVKGNMRFTGGARTVSTETGSLRLQPASGLLIGPVNNIAEVQSATTLKTAHWASGFLGTGWGLTYDGHLDARTIYADELHVAAFIADTARVAVGSEYITPSMALLADNLTIPAVGVATVLYVEDAPGMPDTAVFDNNDWVLLRVMNRAGGGLLVANAWGQVTNYTDRAEGVQSWTFTCRSTTAAGQVVAAGSVALDFGKSGAGWWWVTAIDPAGAPYAGISTWSGANPYTEGNRSHVLRMGQLRGVTGNYEWGLRSGGTTSRYVLFSDLRSEIHGSRLSLYAGDGAQLRVAAAEVRLYRDISTYSLLVPTADHTALNVTSTAGNYYSTVDEGVDAANTADYITNGTNTGGSVSLGLTDPPVWGAIYTVMVRARVVGNGFSNDTVKLYGQVFASDEVTPLTAEELLYTMASNVEITTEGLFDQIDTAATQAQWNGARLRLRWEYAINASEEAIRLDPQVPSLAVGRGLPTGVATGGDGFWVGSDGGTYKLRIGKATGTRLLWDGSALTLRNSSGTAMIELDSSGNSRFAGPMTIGTAGGIWQGTGTFGTPTTGLKLYNTGGIGRLSTFNGGLEQLTINTNGQLTAGNGAVIVDRGGLSFVASTALDWPGSLRIKNSNNAVVGLIGGITNTSTGYNTLRLDAKTVSPGNTSYTSYLQLASGGAITMQVTGAEGSEVYSFEDDRFISTAPIVVESALLGTGATLPATGILRLQERSGGAGAPPAGYGDLYIVDDGTKQLLYVRFENGTLRELARSV